MNNKEKDFRFEVKSKIGKPNSKDARRLTIPRSIGDLLELDKKTHAVWIFELTSDGYSLRLDFINEE